VADKGQERQEKPLHLKMRAREGLDGRQRHVGDKKTPSVVAEGHASDEETPSTRKCKQWRGLVAERGMQVI
jgi:hypothetical protein